MWLKLQLGTFSVIFLTALVFLTSCLEEPIIAPARRPYSVMRVINLSNSSNQIFIDNNQPDGSLGNVINPLATAYFDMNSGARRFVVKDANQDTIFNNNIEIISYERETIVFAGTYDNISENSSYSNMKISEGEIYINANPDADRFHLIVSNAFPGYYSGVEVNPVNFALSATYWPDEDTTISVDTLYIDPDDVDAELLKFGISFGIGNALPGTYKFEFLNATADSVIATDTVVLVSLMVKLAS